MTVEIIACVDENYAIGKGEHLLFKIKEDLKFFRNKSVGNFCVYGRKTFESILNMNGKPLPNRVNVVLTRDENYKAPSGVFVFNCVEDIIKHCDNLGEKDKKIVVCGGQKVYERFLPHADKVYLTHVKKSVEDANVYYPFELQQELGFQKVRKSYSHYDEEENVEYEFIEYKRVK